MADYDDDMNLQADVPDGRRAVRARWNHLFADTEEELRAFAAKIGLKAEWIQDPGRRHAHFDVTTGKRQQAIANGAKAVTWHEAGEFFARQAFEEQRERKAQREAKPVRHSWAADGKPPGNVKIWLRHGGRAASPSHGEALDNHLLQGRPADYLRACSPVRQRIAPRDQHRGDGTPCRGCRPPGRCGLPPGRP